MRAASPLRYPGGKSSMAGLLGSIRNLNGLGTHSIAEPFAGGAGASLSLLFREETNEVFINDADPAIYAFWSSLVGRIGPFLELLLSTPVEMQEWLRQRSIYRDSRSSRLRRGFATFYLNRCNRSGIIMNGGPIGGVEQTGEWKLDARYNVSELATRCAKVYEYRYRIHVSNQDAIQFIEGRGQEELLFIDPPYYHKGQTLYLNRLDHCYHQSLANHLEQMAEAPWVLTYDDCPEIRRMYEGWANIHPFLLRYAASERRKGREILVAPRWMQLPSRQTSGAIEW